jgi:beta-phosphoglucomutase-like phosphatase (HAD superfamily)
VIRAVIFDMDGVVVDSEKAWPVVVDPYIRKIAPSLTLDDLPGLHGLGFDDAYEYIKEHGAVSVSKDEFKGFFLTNGKHVYGQAVNLADGLLPIIGNLREVRIMTALATNSPILFTNIVVDRFNLRPLFDVIVTGEDGSRPKPAPDIYIKLQECWE